MQRTRVAGRARIEGSAWKILWRLFKYILQKSHFALFVAFFSIIVSAGAAVVGTLFIQRLIDDYITPLTKVSNPDFTPLFHVILLMGGIYVLGVIGTLLYSQIMIMTGQKLQKRIRDDMFTHMQKLPLRYFDSNDYGDIMSRYTNDVDTLRQMIEQSFPAFINAIFNVTFTLTAMIALSPFLTVISLLVFALSIFVVRFLSGKSSQFFRLQQKSLGNIDGYIEEMLNGQKVVKVFSHEKQSKAGFDLRNKDLRKDASMANGLSTMLFPIMGNVGNILYVLIAVVGGYFAVNHVTPITFGEIAAFLQLSRSFSQPIAQITMQLNSIIMGLAGAQRMFQLFDEPVEKDSGNTSLVYVSEDAQHHLVETSERTDRWAWKTIESDGSQKLTPVKGHIVFNDVNFSYDGKKTVLHHISLEAKPGEKMAFVGATGAGKTTITNMLNRFYDISSGKITYDGIDIRQIQKASLRLSMGIVLQDTNLFTASIRDNIRYGRLNATDEEVVAAAKLANADSFIRDLPKGYDTVIDGSGSDLSQGQRQLLSIARAAVADPPTMIMDEATSSIDTRTETLVQSGMDNLMRGRTTFVIAHRLSTIHNSDDILVIEDGRIIEEGNHEALMQEKGEYYELYTGKTILE
ncbi:ABC transporter ATP-binding protein/permease [Pediococcus ethanolidurans]|uniref:ABC transporter ATP-binding protein n=1 Tax=Pediococcus ethanolidurans TaxID=319653 RepID=UPI001C1F03DD|nr:ABC transporter ATP-binding protein [Pediococcus ethanolidurans]MBU7554252.1 ABC transporter ATP-binding protein [Pediococcus ethanolidurans]MBU7564122.1 ABC transporter ATP-binding protein [Pediococcus ethanolidurans]MCT4399018.1 ABC transporter ATP-binding protein [Pediococcus ethanolidurans]MCV3323712.1 ABC transporter ATP-binding protein/permease [Pediococcus ethanolidurans]MCV3555232.1 ABC transporter ATP-binding protein/permease [Pediococcus ethanolidurans]